MKKMIKIMALFICIVMIINVGVYAWGTTDINPSGQPASIDNSIKTMGNNTLGIIRTVGVVLSVLMLIVIGIKYMLGSTEEKASYKKSLIPLVVGVLVVMAATQIMTFLVSFFETTGNA